MPAKKKAAKKRAPSKSRKSKASKPSSFLKTITALFILVFIVAATGLIVHLMLPLKKPVQVPPPVTTFKKVPPPPPVFEIYPKEEKEPEPVPVPPLLQHPLPSTSVSKPKEQEKEKNQEKKRGSLPLVSVIIDDIGYDYPVAEGFIKLNPNLTLSILPFSPHGPEIAELAYQEGTEVMLHLPMEPVNYPKTNPGPGTLFENMPPDQLISQLIANLDAIPHIRGVNNHMGSKITTSEPQIHQIFSILKKRELFFIDSRTTPKTICQPAARLFQVPFAQRGIFLDNRLNRVEIQEQIVKLIKMAEENGEAIGIGHAHSITLEVLSAQLSWMKNKVTLVPASEIVHVAETRT